MFDSHSACLLGLSSEFISAPRIDDKLCSFAAMTALINSTADDSFLAKSGVISLVALFDTEEIGSGLRQGAKGNFMQTVIERVIEAQVGVKSEDKSPYTTVRMFLLLYPCRSTVCRTSSANRLPTRSC